MQHDDLFDRGLQFDMAALLERRKVLGLLAGAGLATLAGCGGDSTGAAPNTSSSRTPRVVERRRVRIERHVRADPGGDRGAVPG